METYEIVESLTANAGFAKHALNNKAIKMYLILFNIHFSGFEQLR